MADLWRWVDAHRLTVFLVFFGLTLGTLLLIAPSDLAAAQWAKDLRRFDPAALRRAILLDYALMAAYAVLGWATFSFFRDPQNSRQRHATAAAGTMAVVSAAVADAVENLLLWFAIDRPADNRLLLSAMRGVGLIKWGLLIGAAVSLIVLLVRRQWRAQLPGGLPTARPRLSDQSTRGKHPWDPPSQRDAPRIGVCLSGGGIRSAAFCLGGLQALRSAGKLKQAHYVAAVSGGGYLAAGWAVSDAGPPGGVKDGTPPAWDPGSPEERWFRDHSSYLVPNFKGAFAGLGRLLAGVLVNLLVVGLVLFAISRPIGWAIHYLHEELGAEGRQVLERDSIAEMVVDGVRLVGSVQSSEGGRQLTRYEVDLSPAPESPTSGSTPNDVCFDLPPYARGHRDVCFGVTQERPAVIEVEAGRAKVVRQPTVQIDTEPKPRLGLQRRGCAACDDLAARVVVKDNPTLTLADDVFVDEAALAADVEVAGQPSATIKSGLAKVRHATFEAWMWELSVGLVVGAALLALIMMSVRLRVRHHDVGRAVTRALAGAGVAASLILIGLPWLVVWLPRTFAGLAGAGPEATPKLSPSGSGLQDYLLPGGSLLLIATAAATQFLSADKRGRGTGASKPWYGRLWGAISKRKTELKWYETSPTKILLAVIAIVAAAVLFVNFLQFSAANGPSGRFMGAAFVRDFMPNWLFVPDWTKLVAALAALGVLALAADAHAWSLYPFYKRRLSSAYLLRRLKDRKHAEPIPYHWLLPFAPALETDGDLPGWDGMVSPPRKPQFIACCAVNLSEYGHVPPGRRAASFTFSSTEIGGPVVGYATPQDYWESLPYGRRRDVTVPSAMAISGAAFSPAMGKFNLGAIGSVLALANLRLGVWVGNPRRVQERETRWQWWLFRRPHWGWFLKELTNRYPLNGRYIYVSDGGHWDNLGLVELLRRGCTEIYCISGAGDGPISFGTIGEAIALAREELGVEVKLDPSPLRSPTKGPDKPLPRELRRTNASDTAAPFAGTPFVAGTFEFARDGGAPATGKIYYVEANLTAELPFDVHTFAEAEPVFPDDSTGDQVFNHRQFESYRALGYYQTKSVFQGKPSATCVQRLINKVSQR